MVIQFRPSPLVLVKKGWQTPLASGTVTNKIKNPSWRPPLSIKKYQARRGRYLPDVVPAGPNNPLGKYKLPLSISGYLIHGTNDKKRRIGVRVSAGCIRLLPRDIEQLYKLVPVGTSVRIIHQTHKVGRHKGRVYIEVHESLSENYYKKHYSRDNVIEQIKAKSNGLVTDGAIEKNLRQTLGYPIPLQTPQYGAFEGERNW